MIKKPFPKQPMKNDYGPGELWHCDIAYAGKTASTDGSKHILVCKDDATGYKILYYISTKDQATKCLLQHIEWGLTNRKVLVRALHTDNGSENANKIVREVCQKRGIEHHLSPARTPRMNSVVERENRSH